MTRFCLFLYLISFSTGWSQKISVEFVNCSVQDMKDRSYVPNADIFVLEGPDTVYHEKSDEYGKFNMKLSLDKNEKWKIAASLYSRKSETTIYEPKDSCNYDFEKLVLSIEIVLLKYCTLRDPSVYYEINKSNAPKNLNIESIKEMLTEYPNAKFEYSQTVSKMENPDVTKKRMALFQMLLEQNGVPVSNIIFSSKVYYLNESDQRSRIEGKVISLN